MTEIKYLSNLFQNNNSVLIGRPYNNNDLKNVPNNYIYLPQDKYATRISEKKAHVYLTKDNKGNYFVEDINSTNGTLFNEKQIKGKGKQKIKNGDYFLVGNTLIKKGIIQENSQKNDAIEIEHYNPDANLLEILNISKIVKIKNKQTKTILQPISFSLKSNEFVLIMGGSGSGKSTLLKCLCGESPPETGSIFFKEQNLLQNWNRLKKYIGYVKQHDSLHDKLTVEEELYLDTILFKGSLITNNNEKIIIQNSINKILNELKIFDIKDKKIKDISGGQKKRVAIAIELLKEPSILFLDEPTSPLDPASIRELMLCLKEIQQKRELTLLMVTHKPDDIEYADKIIFLGSNGYNVFIGSKKELLEKFKTKDLVSVYDKVKNNDITQQNYLKPKNANNNISVSNAKIKQKNFTSSAINQFLLLTYRYFLNKIKDKKNIILLLLQSVGIPTILCVANERFEISLLFWIVISAIWFGVSNSAREIVTEIDLFKKERLFNLKILPYIFSKITVLSAFSIVQVLIFVFVIYLKYNIIDAPMNSEPQISNYFYYFLSVFLMTFVALLLGLALSATGKTAERVMTLLPILLIPQIIFSNFTSPVKSSPTEIVSSAMIGRWGMELLSRTQNLNNNFEKEYCNNLADTTKNVKESVWLTVTSLYKVSIGNENYYNCNDEDEYLYLPSTDSLKTNPITVLYPRGFKKKEGDDTDKNYYPLFPEKIYSIKGNILFLLFNGLIYFIIIYFSLKSKDTI